MLYGKMFHGQMLHGQMLHGQMLVRTNVAWTNVEWSNDTGPLVNSQGWFHKLEMSSTVLSLGGGLGGEKLKLMLSQPIIAGTGLGWNCG